jgi:hypothetical protein
MLLGMFSLVNVTMLAALYQLTSQLPDQPLLHILTRYLEPETRERGGLIHPSEATVKLGKLRKKVFILSGITACTASGLTVAWAAAGGGWGPAALALWVAALNLFLVSLPLGRLSRRTSRMEVAVDKGGDDDGPAGGGSGV